ncbi:glycosyltransferase family 2 protein [Sedimentibacter sp. zth1]|uniref:glycosyltransferase family 2 protein n=1 Tax=Sedimentibacter sp. zth1 TaxID=2816908 RepID=UPI001A91FAE4|nr:glycosyltransferase [Sedimentibacter sp. zth1]QSX06913.1 glycosyltransferase family 2 protein [Sedimentibacter sp. zth1]
MSLFRKTDKNSENTILDVLVNPNRDRRLLSNVPDPDSHRTNNDRRWVDSKAVYELEKKKYVKQVQEGIRYICSYDIEVTCINNDKSKNIFICKSLNISATGMLIKIIDKKDMKTIQNAKKVIFKFEIIPGSMPEGYEMKVKQSVIFVRINEIGENNIECGVKFKIPLSIYAKRRRGAFTLILSSLMLFFVTLFILLMRVESVLYFEFNKFFYLYSIIAAVFLLSRYFFGSLYREAKVDINFTPGVTIIIPCFNEEEWIQKTILSCVNQDYPVDNLEIIVVDDYSSDKSVEKIIETIDILHKESERFKTKTRVKYVVQDKNKGKRDALARGVMLAKHELVVFVDSDSFLDPFAIRNLVQPFKDPKMGGVSGRTDVANTYTNTLTKMQSVRYYIAFRIMKAAESYFDAVTCLSGPLSCYKKSIVIEHMDEWLNQKFLRQRATFGDDRSMTNFVLRKHRTCYQDSAICQTIVPNKYKVFLKQQMRWKRSWLRESIIASGFMWKKEPFMAIFFYMGIIVPIAAPIVVLYNLFFVPIVNKVFPLTFIVGILMMSMMMSVTQLFLKRSSTWIFGILFCLYYEAVLLWQMPIAWFTFWKTTWGTRMTPEDVKALKKKEKIKNRGKSKYGN